MFDCFDNEMRYTISSYFIMSCQDKVRFNIDTELDVNNQSKLEFSSMIKKLMCNSDASIIVQKLIEKGFYPKLRELKNVDFC